MRDWDRMITTDMSAKIVVDLLKQGISLDEMARGIKADISFIRGVQGKRHTLTEKDVKSLAKLVDTTSHLLLLNSIRPVTPEMKPLFDIIQNQLETSGQFDTAFRKKRKPHRRTTTKAA